MTEFTNQFIEMSDNLETDRYILPNDRYILPNDRYILPNDRYIILDMDGTLGDHVPIQLQKKIQGAPLEVEPIARPYVDLFIKYLFKRNFKVSIWTAGTSEWFKKFYTKVIEPCMPPGKILEFVYTRADYDYIRGTKPLSKVYAANPEYNPNNTTIIDDNPLTFIENEDNAICIKSFFYDLIEPKYRADLEHYDYELLRLIKVLEQKILGKQVQHDELIRECFIPKSQEDELRELEELKKYVTTLLL